MNSRSVCTLFYHRALHVDESAGFLWYTLHWFRGEEGGRGDVRGGGGRQTPLFFREKRINKYIYILAIMPMIRWVRCMAEKERYASDVSNGKRL